MNSRIKNIRKEFALNQDEFGARLGITGSGLSNIENGKRNVTEQMILAICREFAVNEKWLRTGEGAMFVETDDSIIANVAAEYHLSALDKAILKIFLELPPEKRTIMRDFSYSLIDTILNNDELHTEYQQHTQKKVQPSADNFDIESELSSYRRELELEKTAKEKSEASPDSKEA
ncbi:MAG: helix-turn-helix transcriptional regulator [Butyricicoccus pullicaecorum]|nr:helix-turn-helix transcriptional regulator [Butyricicoccus pullicaecorum]